MHGAIQRLDRRRAAGALALGTGVGALGGLIGLGGAEFRLPFLIGLFAMPPHRAVRLNALVSLATVLAAAVARFGSARFPALGDLAIEILCVTGGAVVAAWIGAGWLARLSAAGLARLVAALLIVVAALLLGEAVFAFEAGDGLPEGWMRLAGGVLAGLAIGTIASLLGVAGGEFLIPLFMFGFGADVATAGTASLIVSIPTVAVGVLRFWRQGAYRDPGEVVGVALPMAAGSVVGAAIGAALLPFAPARGLKATLGVILAVSAWKLARKH